MPAVRAYYFVPSLAKIRFDKHLTQQQLATKADTSRQNIAQLENQKAPQRARMGTIEKLAAALDVSVDALMQDVKPVREKRKEKVTA